MSNQHKLLRSRTWRSLTFALHVADLLGLQRLGRLQLHAKPECRHPSVKLEPSKDNLSTAQMRNKYFDR